MRTRGQQLAGDVLVSTHICQQARPVPVRAKSAERALAGSWLTDSAVRAAAEMVIEGALPLSDNGYKCNLIVNLTERALRKNRDQRA